MTGFRGKEAAFTHAHAGFAPMDVVPCGNNGSSMLSVDPAYTSQTCPICGHVDKKSRNHEKHTFKCTACGYTTNDDRIGSMNLQRMGIEYLLKAQVSNG